MSQGSNDSDLAPALTEEEVIQVMTKILDSLKLKAGLMLKQFDQIREQIEAQGQRLDDEKFKKRMLLPQFEKLLQEVQNQIFDEFDVDESEVDDAVTTYIREGNNQLRDINEKIQLLYQNFGGDSKSSTGSGNSSISMMENSFGDKEINVTKLIEMLELLANLTTAFTNEFVERFKSEHGLPNQQTVLQFQEGMMELSQK